MKQNTDQNPYILDLFTKRIQRAMTFLKIVNIAYFTSFLKGYLFIVIPAEALEPIRRVLRLSN